MIQKLLGNSPGRFGRYVIGITPASGAAGPTVISVIRSSVIVVLVAVIVVMASVERNSTIDVSIHRRRFSTSGGKDAIICDSSQFELFLARKG